MGLTIFWTETARMQLQNIFNYHRNNVSLKVAQNLRNQIYNRTNQLEMFPQSGPIEPLLYRRNIEYRYLVEGNYKIIYSIENQVVKIATVFDCRQNPTKMKI